MPVFYHLVTRMLIPFLPFYLRWRVWAGKEDRARLDERKGITDHPRPRGKVFWLHAASVGETISAMSLARALLDGINADNNATILLTSGTLTSAETYARRGHEFASGGKMLHQFAPLDAPPFVRRFLDHWRPDLMVLVEGDIWPNALAAARARGIPVTLASAQLSERSRRFWRQGFGRRMAASVFSAFDMILAIDDENARRFASLPVRGDCIIEAAGSMKLAAPPPVSSPTRIAAIEAAAGGRMVLALLSSHDGEERLFMDAIGRLERGRYFGIIAPRHATRGSGIAAIAARASDNDDISVGLASRDGDPQGHDDLWIADTMGEMGSLIRASDIIVLGGGFANLGGHNPMEMAMLGKGVISGRNVFKNGFAFDLLKKHHGVIFADNAFDLADSIALLASSPSKIAALGNAARTAAGAATGSASTAASKLLGLINTKRGTPS